MTVKLQNVLVFLQNLLTPEEQRELAGLLLGGRECAAPGCKRTWIPGVLSPPDAPKRCPAHQLADLHAD